MKKILLLAGALFIGYVSYAQAPQKMSYQAVIRNNSNTLVANTAVGTRISILQGSASGTAVFVETHQPTTNSNGLATFQIGGGTAVSGSFASIDWADGPTSLKPKLTQAEEQITPFPEPVS